MTVEIAQSIPLHPFITADLQHNIDRSESQQWWAETTKAVAEVAMCFFTVGAFVIIGTLAPAYITYAYCFIMFDLYLEAFNGGLFALFNSFVLEPLHETVLITTENTERLQATQTIALEIGTLNDAQIEARLDSLEFNPQMIDRSEIPSLSTLRNPIAGYEYYQKKSNQTYECANDIGKLIQRLEIYLDLTPNSYEYNYLESTETSINLNGEGISPNENFTQILTFNHTEDPITIRRTNLIGEEFSSQERFVEEFKSDMEKLESFGNPDYATTISYLKRVYLNESEELSQTPLSEHLQPQNITNIKNQASLILQRLRSNIFSHIFKTSIYKIKAAFMAHIIMCPTETRAKTPAFGQFHTELSELHRRQLSEVGYGPLFSTLSGRVFTLEDTKNPNIQDLALEIFGSEPIPNTEAALEVVG